MSQEAVRRPRSRPGKHQGGRGHEPRGVLEAAQGRPPEGPARGPGVRERFEGRRQENLEDGEREIRSWRGREGGGGVEGERDGMGRGDNAWGEMTMGTHAW